VHHFLHQEEVVLQHAQFSAGHIQLVNDLAPLLGQFGVDEFVDFSHVQITLRSVVEPLLLFHVNQVLVLESPELFCFRARAQLSFSVFKQTPAEELEALVEIFQGEHDAGTACESLDLCAPVPQPSQEGLHEGKLVDHFQVRVLVN
jgi:hypothetical protein